MSAFGACGLGLLSSAGRSPFDIFDHFWTHSPPPKMCHSLWGSLWGRQLELALDRVTQRGQRAEGGLKQDPGGGTI